ncbi:MAG TPA: hypothetical protein VF057_00345 [Thermoanaerobaculia bacterium]
MSRATIAVAIVMFAAAALQVEGQTASQTPTLVSGTTENGMESPMVQAAKRAIAARQKSGTPSKVITNETVAQSTGVLTTASEPADSAQDAAGQTAKATDAAPAAPTPAARAPQTAAPARTNPPRQPSNEVQVPSFDRSPKPAENTSTPQESPNAGPNRPPAP